jgi:hypothetical protein
MKVDLEIAELVTLLREIVNDPHSLPESIALFQRLIWKEPLTGSSAVQEIMRELAYDLEFYEPDPRSRAEDPSFFE